MSRAKLDRNFPGPARNTPGSVFLAALRNAERSSRGIDVLGLLYNGWRHRVYVTHGVLVPLLALMGGARTVE